MTWFSRKKKIRHIFVFFILAVVLIPSYASAKKVARFAALTTTVQVEDKLIVEILKRGGKYDLEYTYGNSSRKSVPISTKLKAIENHESDIFCTMTSLDYEERFLPIRIPIYRGMLGMRVPMVRKDKLNIFKDVETLEDLRQFKAGQGTLWIDRKILESNGIPVIKEFKYSNLFSMLEAERFDYFPRGINQAWAEAEREENLDLAIEESIMVWYTSPFYYFVRKTDTELAAHITEIFEEMITDGSFLKMFYDDTSIRAGIERANISKRKTFKLNNPYMPKHTPIDRPELWFDPRELDDQVSPLSLEPSQ